MKVTLVLNKKYTIKLKNLELANILWRLTLRLIYLTT